MMISRSSPTVLSKTIEPLVGLVYGLELLRCCVTLCRLNAIRMMAQSSRPICGFQPAVAHARPDT